MRAAVRHTRIDDPSAGVGREKQEQKGRAKLSRPMHIVCDNAEPTPHAGIVLVTTQRLGDGDELSVRRSPTRRPFLVGGQ